MVMATPFDGLTKFQINKLFDLLGVHIYKFSKNQEVLPTIKNKNIVKKFITTDDNKNNFRMQWQSNKDVLESYKNILLDETNIKQLHCLNIPIRISKMIEIPL